MRWVGPWGPISSRLVLLRPPSTRRSAAPAALRPLCRGADALQPAGAGLGQVWWGRPGAGPGGRPVAHACGPSSNVQPPCRPYAQCATALSCMLAPTTGAPRTRAASRLSGTPGCTTLGTTTPPTWVLPSPSPYTAAGCACRQGLGAAQPLPTARLCTAAPLYCRAPQQPCLLSGLCRKFYLWPRTDSRHRAAVCAARLARAGSRCPAAHPAGRPHPRRSHHPRLPAPLGPARPAMYAIEARCPLLFPFPCLQTEFKQPIYAAEASYHPSVVGPLGPVSATKVHQVRAVTKQACESFSELARSVVCAPA